MPKSAKFRSSVVLVVFVYLTLMTGLLLHASDMKPEEVVAKHLDSIGTPAARAAIKNRVVQGSAKFKLIVGGSGELDGKGGLVSEQRKGNFVLKFNGDYRGEQIVSNGDKAYVAATQANHKRSNFGEFIHTQDFVVKEGLLGGELSTGWALANLDKLPAKLEYSGLKKFDGQPVMDLRYHSKKHDDMNIHIYLDPQTFRHVATVYSIELSPNLGGQGGPSATDQVGLTSRADQPGADVTQSSRQREIRYTVEERFTDFKAVDGLTLPSHYDLRYTQELQSGSTIIYKWDLNADDIAHNVSLDPRNFDVK
ncbi:MAG TPA: hypothetical protein VLK33_09845 [Terriglobales bacterium]|nr:hypothetical protein [Terriglobales bacterium]